MSEPLTPQPAPVTKVHKIPFVGAPGVAQKTLAPEPTTEFKSAVKGKDIGHLVELAEDLRAITTTTEDGQELIRRFLDAVAARGRLFAIAWVEVRRGGQPEVVQARFKNPKMDTSSMRQQLVESAVLSVQNPAPQVYKTEKLRGSLFACVPFFKDEQTTAVVCGLLHDDNAKCGEALMICQNVSNHYDLWRSRDQLTSMALEVRSTATVLELIGKAECSITLKDACVKIANELQTLFHCDYVAVGINQGNSVTCRLMAVSALAEFDSQSRTTTLIRSAFDEAMLRGRYTSFPAIHDPHASPALSHKKLAQHLRCEAAITIPLRNQREELLGAITILGNRGLDRNASTRNLINALEHPVGSCVEVVRLAEGGLIRKLQRLLITREKTNTKVAAWALILISLVAMMIPVPYRIYSKCTAEPVVRSFSVAPHDGLLESTLAEPGDVIEKGQVLAKMDGREIGFKISSIVAETNRAATERDSFRANGKISESIQAGLEARGLEAELGVLQHKQQNLEIKSTIDGVVLAGSIDKRENYPVTLGQTLYEIAPISPLRVELAIPADEIMHVVPGQQVKFRFNGFGTETISGVVERIRPSSTIRDDENVFIAEAVLQNQDGKVRPGMEGYARVYGSNHSLGWSLFHRPWEKFVSAIGF